MNNIKINYEQTIAIVKEFLSDGVLSKLKQVILKQYASNEEVQHMYINYLTNIEVMRIQVNQYKEYNNSITLHDFNNLRYETYTITYNYLDNLCKEVFNTIYTNEYSGTTLYDIFNRFEYIKANMNYSIDELKEEITMIDFD